MRNGLFGKLPAKRDFVAVGTPRDLLSPWERWMQGGVAASRDALGAAWQDAYLRAPLWRFWLGADLCGASVAGAFMPSVDGVGRYFPLTVFAQSDSGEAIPPPELDPQDAWFEAAEDLLLSALAPEATYEAVRGGLAGLRAPACAPGPAAPGERGPDGTLVATIGEGGLPDLLASLRAADHARLYAGATFWWTVGGEDYAPRALAARGLPTPHLFAGMLTGRFDAPAAALA
jgi:type VI secretion system protein ImpM